MHAKTFMTYELGIASESISGNEISFSDLASTAKFSAFSVSLASSVQGQAARFGHHETEASAIETS